MNKQNNKTKTSAWLPVMLLFLPIIRNESVSENDGCQTSNLCLIDAKNCLVIPQVEYEAIGSCQGDVEYSKLYKSRTKEASFRITAKSAHQNWTFTVIEIEQTNSAPVEKCCHLKTNEVCSLRKLKNEKNIFRIFGANGNKFCYKYVEEYPSKELKFCQEDDKSVDNCLSVENGIFSVKGGYYGANLGDLIAEETEYCFFEAVVKDVTGKVPKDGLTQIENSISLINTSAIAIPGQPNTKCDVKRMGQINVTQYFGTNNPKHGHVHCFFARLRDEEWFPNPWCNVQDLKKPEFWRWTWAYTVIIVIGVVIVLLVGATLVYRTKFKKISPPYWETEKEILRNKTLAEEKGKFMSHQVNEEHCANEKEIVDEIIIEGISHAHQVYLKVVQECMVSDNKEPDKIICHRDRLGSGFEVDYENRDVHAYNGDLRKISARSVLVQNNNVAKSKEEENQLKGSAPSDSPEVLSSNAPQYSSAEILDYTRKKDLLVADEDECETNSCHLEAQKLLPEAFCVGEYLKKW